MSISIPVVMGASGAIPTPVSTLQSTLINAVAATNPDYTANLPGSLIEDISSTDVGAMAVIDQARVDAINSVTPYGANAALLSQLGVQFGLPQGQPTNTGVYVVFTGPVGYVIPVGFVVSDGTHQYALQDGGVIGTGGSSPALYAVATSSGSWAVPASTVTTIVTSVPSGYTLTVTNPQAGTAGQAAESVQSYRSRILQASQAGGQGIGTYLRTLLQAISGVNAQLVSIRQVADGWSIICGGGDPYAIAGAIYKGVLDLSSIVGSSTTSRNITVTLTDPPDSYSITFINPQMQTVTMAVTWNTNLPNFTASAQVNQLAAPALVSYINSVIVGQPLNTLEMTAVFQSAIANVLPSIYLSHLEFSISINGVIAIPVSGTSLIASDPESYFYSASNGVTVGQG